MNRIVLFSFFVITFNFGCDKGVHKGCIPTFSERRTISSNY